MREKLYSSDQRGTNYAEIVYTNETNLIDEKGVYVQRERETLLRKTI